MRSIIIYAMTSLIFERTADIFRMGPFPDKRCGRNSLQKESDDSIRLNIRETQTFSSR